MKTYKLVPTEDTPVLGEIRYTLDPLSLATEPIIWNGTDWLAGAAGTGEGSADRVSQVGQDATGRGAMRRDAS